MMVYAEGSRRLDVKPLGLAALALCLMTSAPAAQDSYDQKPAAQPQGGPKSGAQKSGAPPANGQYTPPQYTPPKYTPPQYTPPQYSPPQYTPPQYTPPQYKPPEYIPPQYPQPPKDPYKRYPNAKFPPGQYRGSEQDQQACIGDVFRLCNQAIPDVSRIIACLQTNRRNLSPPCRAVFSRGKGPRKGKGG